MPRIRVDLAGRRGHGVAQRRRGTTVHLPEPAGVDAELPARHGLDHRLACRGVGCGRTASAAPAAVVAGTRDDAHAPIRRLHEVEPSGTGGASAQRGALDGGSGQRQLVDLDHAVAARGERSDAAVGVDVQAHACAPSGAVLRLVVDGLDGHRTVEAGEPPQRIADDLALQLTLVGELDVAEVGPARPLRGWSGDVGGPPDMGPAVRRGHEHVEHLAPPERALRGVGQPHAHPLPRNRVGHEHDTPPALAIGVVSSDEHTAVRGGGHVEVDQVCGIHSSTLVRDAPRISGARDRATG